MAQSSAYSGIPLPKKLGFTPGMTVLLREAPARCAKLLSDSEAVTFTTAATEPVDAVHVFLLGPEGLAARTKAAIAQLSKGGMMWMSWAKKLTPLHAGVTEDDLRTHILPLGWVGVKMCALDQDWSGLIFLKRNTMTG